MWHDFRITYLNIKQFSIVLMSVLLEHFTGQENEIDYFKS